MSTAAAAVAAAPDRRAFWIRRLHSLSGLVPVGAFMAFHLFENSSAWVSKEAYDATVRKIGELPYLYALEAGGIWIPILFHAILGFVIIFEGKPNATSYPYARNWMYLMQRVTGIVAFAFILFHFFNFRARKEEFDRAPFDDVANVLKEPWIFWFYLVGIAACVFHLANGVAGFLFSWGFTVGPRSKTVAAWACAGVGAAVFALGMRSLFAFRMDLVPGFLR